jgi:antitoxin component of MazEF toxin-antitoxin module
MTDKVYISKVIDILENGDALVELPTELLEELGWKVGDVIDFDLKENSVILKNLTKDDRNERNNNSQTSIR